jgi:hypothetical protein
MHNRNGDLLPPAAATWLASGPTFGFVIVQLDPANQYEDVVTLIMNPAKAAWQPELETSISAPCAQGTAMTGTYAFLGATCGIGVEGSTAAPVNTVYYWSTPTPAGDQFFGLRIAAAAQRPATGANSVTLAGGPGWWTAPGSYTSVVLPLAQGQTLVFAGTAGTAQVLRLAAQIAANLDATMPLRTQMPPISSTGTPGTSLP